MNDDEIKTVATAICNAHVKEGVGDWRAYKEIATSIIAGMDALWASRMSFASAALLVSDASSFPHNASAIAGSGAAPIVLDSTDAPTVETEALEESPIDTTNQVGSLRLPLLVRWSDQDDYENWSAPVAVPEPVHVPVVDNVTPMPKPRKGKKG